ncbi:MAG: calcium-binding protein [Geminocystis sp. GBBB08]|nr:calcium-binding protein [Geminocystis sp. GBBB08]
MEVTISVNNGTLTLGTTAGLQFIGSNVNGTSTVKFRGSETALNTALASLSYQGNLDYNTLGTSKDVLNIAINDLGNTGTINGVLGASNIVNQTVNISVTPVNDAPIIINQATLPSIDAIDSTNINPIGKSVSNLLNGYYSDSKDNVIGGSSSTPLAGIAIVNNPNNLVQGKWQYTNPTGNVWYDVPTNISTSNAFVLPSGGNLRFLPTAGFSGTPDGLTIHVSDGLNFQASSLTSTMALKNISSELGGSNGWSLNTTTITTQVNRMNTPPVINELDGDVTNYLVNAVPIKIDQVYSPFALATISDFEGLKTGGTLTVSLKGYGVNTSADVLGINNSYLSGFAQIQSNSNGTLVIAFTQAPTVAQANALIQNITFGSTNKLGVRAIDFTVNDGETNNNTSNTATAFINVIPTGVSYSSVLIGDANGQVRSDILNGTSSHDILNGRGANDILYGFDGNDILIGGDGNDRLDGGNGDNILISTTGNNTFISGTGKDTLIGGTGNDQFNSGAGNDFLTGGLGADTLTGSTGADTFDYINGKHSLLGTTTSPAFDLIMDFNVSQLDKLMVSSIPSRLTNLGTVSSLTESGIQSILKTTTFLANDATLFKFGSRNFLAINDSVVGFDCTKDTLIEISFTGTLTNSIFTVPT